MIEVNGKTIETDETGYLKNFLDWNADVAAKIAETEGLELNEERMEVVLFVRDFYENYNPRV